LNKYLHKISRPSLLHVNNQLARFERGLHLTRSYFRQFGFVEVDQGCICSRLENHCTIISVITWHKTVLYFIAE